MTLTAIPSSWSRARQVTDPPEVNFTAFEMRLITTCISRSGSPTTGGRSVATSRTSARCFWSKSDEVADVARSMMSAIATVSMCHSSLPASILARSSTSSINFVSRSPSLTTTSRFSPICWTVCLTRRSSVVSSGKIRSSSRFLMILAKPSTEVSGVRSSWLTVERKAPLAASASSAAARACLVSSKSRALWIATPTLAAIVVSRRRSASLNRPSSSVFCTLSTPMTSLPTGIGTPRYDFAATLDRVILSRALRFSMSWLIRSGSPVWRIREVMPAPRGRAGNWSPYPYRKWIVFVALSSSAR